MSPVSRALRTRPRKRGAGLTGATRPAPPYMTGQRAALQTGSTMGALAIVRVPRRTLRLALRFRAILGCFRWLEAGRESGKSAILSRRTVYYCRLLAQLSLPLLTRQGRPHRFRAGPDTAESPTAAPVGLTPQTDPDI